MLQRSTPEPGLERDAHQDDPRAALDAEVREVRAAYEGARGRDAARVERGAAETWAEHNAVEGRRLVREIVLEWVEPRAGLRVLDAGCGYGELARGLAAAGAEVTGVDLVEERVAAARAAAGPAGPTFATGSFLDRLAADRFDVVVLVEVLEDYSPAARVTVLRAVAAARPARVVLAFRTADTVRGGLWDRFGAGRADRIHPIELLRRVHVDTPLRQRRQRTVGVRNYRAQVGDLVLDRPPGG